MRREGARGLMIGTSLQGQEFEEEEEGGEEEEEVEEEERVPPLS